LGYLKRKYLKRKYLMKNKSHKLGFLQ